MRYYPFWLFLWANEATAISSGEGLRSFESSIYSFDAVGVLFGTLIQVLFLFVIIAISVLKP